MLMFRVLVKMVRWTKADFLGTSLRAQACETNWDHCRPDLQPTIHSRTRIGVALGPVGQLNKLIKPVYMPFTSC